MKSQQNLDEIWIKSQRSRRLEPEPICFGGTVLGGRVVPLASRPPKSSATSRPEYCKVVGSRRLGPPAPPDYLLGKKECLDLAKSSGRLVKPRHFPYFSAFIFGSRGRYLFRNPTIVSGGLQFTTHHRSADGGQGSLRLTPTTRGWS